MIQARTARPDSRRPIHERARYLATFAEFAALAGALRSVRPRTERPVMGQRPLRAAFLSPHPTAHLGTLVRFTRWLPHLARLGCEAEVLTPSTDSQFAEYQRAEPGADTRYYHACVMSQWRNIRRAADADVVVLHRGLFPFSPWQRPTFEALLARINPHLVYDFYDAIWVQRQQASGRGSRVNRWLHPSDKIEEIIRLARVVTVSNESLADFARPYHEDVRIVPLLLEPEEYVAKVHEVRSPVVLGWLGGRFNLPRLHALAPALRRLAATRDIVLHVVSPDRVEIPGVPVKSFTHPWSPESERRDLAALDVGLLPLEDNVDDRNKSPLKLLQYFAAGLPVVATPMAMDRSLLRSGESFLAAGNESQWLECMTRLVDDVSLRQRLGRTARKTVIDHYSFERHAPQFLEALLAAAHAQPESVPAAA